MTTTWVTCPICKETDMPCESVDECTAQIHCTNHACPSNIVGGDPVENRLAKHGEHLFQMAKSYGWKDGDGEGPWEFLSRKTYEVATGDTELRFAVLLGWAEDHSDGNPFTTATDFLKDYFSTKPPSFFYLEAIAVRKRLSSEDWYAKADTPEYRDLQDRCMRLVSCSEFGNLLSRTKNIG